MKAKQMFMFILTILLLFTYACKKEGEIPEKMTKLDINDYPSSKDIKKDIIVGRTANGITVTVKDVYDWIDLYYPNKKAIILTDQAEMEKLISKILEQKIGIYIAKKRGYDREPDYINAMRRLKKHYELQAEVNLIKKLITIEIDKRINMSQTAIKRFYKENRLDIDRYFVYIIKTQCFPNSSKEEVLKAKKKIEEAYKLLKNGSDFIKVARMYTEGNPQWIATGGLIGWTNLGDNAKAYDYSLEKLKPKSFSEPFLTPEGWIIIYVSKVEKFKERYDYVKSVYYDKMVGRMNIPTKQKILKPYKREIYLKPLNEYIRGYMK